MRDCRSGTIDLDVMNMPASSASTADDITIFTICEIVRMSPLNIGIGLSLERYMCAPARMHDFFKNIWYMHGWQVSCHCRGMLSRWQDMCRCSSGSGQLRLSFLQWQPLAGHQLHLVPQ